MIKFRPAVKRLPVYVPGVSDQSREGVLKLSSNENSYGCSSTITEIFKKEDFFQYPDATSDSLKKKIAKLHNVDQNCLSLGHGSNDVLESIAKAILSPDDEVLAPKYSFLVYKIVTQLMGAHYRESPVDDNFSYSSDQLLGQVTDKTKIVFIASPNNPTGFTLSFQDLYHIAESLSDKTLLVIDEAYMEYAVLYGYQSFIKRALKMKNCIVVRTFSKAYGLAGLRIGYMVAHPELIHDMEKVRQPFHVSSFAQKSAEKACEDQDFIKRTSQKIMDNKRR